MPGSERNDDPTSAEERSHAPAGSEVGEEGSPAGDNRQQFIKSFFRKGAELTEELLEENKRLNFRVVGLDEEIKALRRSGAGDTTAAIRELLGRIESLEQERENMRQGFEKVEAESREYEERFAEIAEENERLANMFVAADQLHSTLDLREVLQIIREIVLNFIGGGEFAVLALDETTRRLFPMIANGVPLSTVPEFALGDGSVGSSILNNKVFVSDEISAPEKPDWAAPLACIPLCLAGRSVGAIVINRYLVQKKEIVDIDHALFDFLGAHAATAIEGARHVTGGAPQPMTREALSAILGG